MDDLIDGVGFYRLLTVPEGGVSDPDLFGHAHRHTAVVKSHLGDGAVGIHFPVEVGFGDILQRVFI